MLNQNTDLVEFVIQSIVKYPHHWILENDELDNAKAKINVNKLRIATIDDQGRPLVQSLDSVFGGTYNAILRYYNEYVVQLTQHRVKQLFPLDLYYEILENIEENFNDWTALSQSQLHNQKLQIDVVLDLSVFRSESTINGLNISNELASKLMTTYLNEKKKNKKIQSQQSLQQSLFQVEELRNRMKNN